MAKLLVYLLRPGGGLAFTMLERIIKAVESYLHPSNGGYWTYRLSQLLASLCEYMSERVNAERDLPDNDPCKLGAADINNIAALILPLALQGLYSKSGTATLQSCVAFKYLGSLAAGTTLPPLLERAYQALTTLTEVHQTNSALEALAGVIYPVIRAGNFETGIGHVPELMELTLSGIDANDLPKTWATLRFYTVLLSGLPLIPIPEACPEGCDAQRHELARRASDAFADWCFRFLDQTFTFIVNHNSMAPSPGAEPAKQDADTRTSEYFFHCTLEVFFVQLGDELYASALNKVANFCLTNLLLPQQQAQLGVVVAAMAAVQPVMTVKKLLPMCLRILLVSPSDTGSARTPRTPSSARVRRTGSSSSPGSALKASPNLKPGLHVGGEQSPDKECATPTAPDGSAMSGGYKLALLSEMEMVYYLNLIRYVVDNAGDAVLPHRDQIMAAIDLALKVEERPGVVSLEVFKAANKLVRALIHSLVTCRPAEHRSVPPTLWNDAEWQKKHYQSWGHVIDIASVDITWITPSKEGLQWAADLAARYMCKSLALLKKYASAIKAQEQSAEQSAAAGKSTANGHQQAPQDSMQVDCGGGGGTATHTSTASILAKVSGAAHVNGEQDTACAGGGDGQAREGKKHMDLEIHVPNRTCDPPASAPKQNLMRRKVSCIHAHTHTHTHTHTHNKVSGVSATALPDVHMYIQGWWCECHRGSLCRATSAIRARGSCGSHACLGRCRCWRSRGRSRHV